MSLLIWWGHHNHDTGYSISYMYFHAMNCGGESRIQVFLQILPPRSADYRLTFLSRNVRDLNLLTDIHDEASRNTLYPCFGSIHYCTINPIRLQTLSQHHTRRLLWHSIHLSRSSCQEIKYAISLSSPHISPLTNPPPATQKAPTIGFTTTTALKGNYLLAIIDIDGSSGGKSTTVLHALLQDYTPSSTTQNGTSVLTTKATGPSSYFGPAPPAGQPPTHRYVFLLHEQPATFAVPSSQKQVVQSRLGIDWVKFMSEAGLKEPIAGNYLQVKSGDNTL